MEFLNTSGIRLLGALHGHVGLYMNIYGGTVCLMGEVTPSACGGGALKIATSVHLNFRNFILVIGTGIIKRLPIHLATAVKRWLCYVAMLVSLSVLFGIRRPLFM